MSVELASIASSHTNCKLSISHSNVPDSSNGVDALKLNQPSIYHQDYLFTKTYRNLLKKRVNLKQFNIEKNELHKDGKVILHVRKYHNIY